MQKRLSHLEHLTAEPLPLLVRPYDAVLVDEARRTQRFDVLRRLGRPETEARFQQSHAVRISEGNPPFSNMTYLLMPWKVLLAMSMMPPVGRATAPTKPLPTPLKKPAAPSFWAPAK